jgi:hypothetical protein
MKKIVLALAVLAGTAQADISDVVEIHGCEPAAHDLDNLMICRFTNHGQAAVSALSFHHLHTEEGREVPWVDTRTDSTPWGRIGFAGGIEPGETIEEVVRLPFIPARADRERIDFHFIPVSAVDHEGNVID